MPEASRTFVYVFSQLNTIMTEMSACNVFTYSTRRDARDTPGCFNLHDNYSSYTSVARHEPWCLVLKLAHTHAYLMSIHSQWDSESCFAARSSPGSVCRHGVNAVELNSVGGRLSV